jgi:rhodanese-related sulfurtransferase
MKKISTLLIILSFIISSCAQSSTKEKEAKDAPAKTEQTVQKEETVEHISNSDFKAKIEGKEVQLVDVRTPGEYEEGHLENAVLIDYKNPDFAKNATEKLDKTKPVYVYCRSGHRSANSAEILRKEGFTKVYDMKGGIMGWKAADFKVVK